jgi:hypothetical protein
LKVVKDDIEEKKSSGQFDWIVGVWKNPDSNAIEEWEKSSDHLFLGTGYVESKGERIVKEKIRIESINGNYYYIAEIPETSISVTFDITYIGESGFICESKEINFPRKISYELSGFDNIQTHLEGLGKKLNFNLKKLS